jgi:hypothetical protein
MVWVHLVLKLAAITFGRYPILKAVFLMSFRVGSLINGLSFSARETVEAEMLSFLAMS